MGEKMFLPSMMERGSQEDHMERVFDQHLGHVIFQSHKLNEGHNGIILDFNAGDDEYLRHALMENGSNGEPFGSVMKVLKVYNKESPGVGKEEFRKQEIAYGILKEARRVSDEEFAGIPRPLLYKDFPLNEVSTEKLCNLGANVDTHAEIIFMDEVPGDDLATILYRELLKRHPDARHLENEDLDTWSVDDLHAEVARLFFSKPSQSTVGGLEERHMARDRVFRANAEVLIQKLAATGFRVDQRVIDIIRRSLRVLRQHGVALLDAHERNFIIDGDVTDLGERGRIYIIDFGDAKITDGAVTDDDFEGHRSDMAVPLFLGKMNRLADERRRKEESVPWFQRDPKASRVNTQIIAKKNAFAKKQASALGMAESRKEDRVGLFESCVDSAIEKYRNDKTFDVSGLLKALSKSGAKLKKETASGNAIWGKNAYLCGIAYKVYENFIGRSLDKDAVVDILRALREEKFFSEVFDDERYHRYWRDFDFPSELADIFERFSQKENKTP